MANQRREQGLGSVLRHKGCKRYVIQYYVNGRSVRESTGLTDKAAAQRLLNQRLATVARGEPVPLRQWRIGQLYDHLKKSNDLNGKNTDTSRWRLHLEPHFGNLPVQRLTIQTVMDYRVKRSQAGAKTGTVNRELALLRRILKVAQQDGLISVAPHIGLADEDNVRTGFVSDARLDRMRKAAKPLWLRTMLELGATYGWRKGELLGLTVGRVDFTHDTIRLEVGETKNDHGREVPMTPEVRALLVQCCTGRKLTDKVLRHEGGDPVVDPRCAWHNLCVQCGEARWECRGCKKVVTTRGRCTCGLYNWRYVGLLVHDLRRTAARNLRRAGIAENVAMTITGHKTNSQFRRYDIVDNTDRRAALQQLQQYARAARALPDISGGQSSGQTTDGEQTVQ